MMSLYKHGNITRAPKNTIELVYSLKMCWDILEGHDNRANLVLDIIFEASRCSRSTNPKDAVYSLMLLASDALNKPSTLNAPMQYQSSLYPSIQLLA